VGVSIFCTRPGWPWSSSRFLYNRYWVSFPGVKQLGHDVGHPAPSRAKVKERVELYLYFYNPNSINSCNLKCIYN
jgi:hypothetical protein